MVSSDRQRLDTTITPSEPLPTRDVDAVPSIDALPPDAAPVDGTPVETPLPVASDDGPPAPFTHAPAPRRTQPPVNVSADDLAGEDYAESTSYTVRGRGVLSGAGYRRSRHQARQLQRDLRYGQYLEVPKGQRAIFASQGRRGSTALALVIALAIILAVVALVILLWPL